MKYLGCRCGRAAKIAGCGIAFLVSERLAPAQRAPDEGFERAMSAAVDRHPMIFPGFPGSSWGLRHPDLAGDRDRTLCGFPRLGPVADAAVAVFAVSAPILPKYSKFNFILNQE
jgi:hypothetical protein